MAAVDTCGSGRRRRRLNCGGLVATLLAALFVVVAAGCSASGESIAHAGTAAKHRSKAATRCRLAGPGHTERVNVSTGGQQANASTFRGNVSADGRFVVFASFATSLVPNDTNGVEDVFLRDLRLGTTTRVSVSSTGVEGNGGSLHPMVSADGRLIYFRSRASNLVPADRDGVEDLFVHDRITGRTSIVPLGPIQEKPNRAGGPTSRPDCDKWCTNDLSADGSVLLLSSRAPSLTRGDMPGDRDVFVLAHGRLIRVDVGPAGEGNGVSEGSSISADGHVVTYRSWASDIVRDDTNKRPDVFVRDWVTGVTQRANVSSSGAQADGTSFRGVLSADGRYVGFRSRAKNLVKHDTNDALDVFIRDLRRKKTIRISVASSGTQADPRGLSKAVRYRVFMSRPFLSRHGRFAAFTSRAANLVRGDTNRHSDIFVRDLKLKRTVRVNMGFAGQADSTSSITGISDDGRVIGYMSYANNLVPGDTNGVRDYFVRIRDLRGICG